MPRELPGSLLVGAALAALLLSPRAAHAQQASGATVEIAVGLPESPPQARPLPARAERAREKAPAPSYEHAYGVFGLHGVTSWSREARGAGAQAWLAGAELSSNASRVVALRSHTNLAAGYGQPQGFLGEARVANALGPRLAPGEDAPAMLLGMELLALRAPTFYHSLVEVPQLSVGYHHADAARTIEVGARMGYVAVGRYNPEQETRKLGKGGAFGLYAASVWRRGLLELDYRAIRPLDGAPTRVVHLARVTLCAGGPFSLCVNGMVLRGEVVGGSRPISTALLGVSVGANPSPEDEKEPPRPTP